MRHASRFALALAATLAPTLSLAQDQGTQPGALRHPLQPADSCAECHSGGTTGAGERYMAHDTWVTSMMANAARDPLFLATVSVAEQESPGIRALCLRCHTPTAHTNGHARTGMLDPLAGDLDGVHCDSCHRSVVPTDVPGAPFVSNAQLFFNDSADGIPTRFGPREDPAMSPRHPSAGSAWIRDARLCGQCHDLTHPTQNRLSPTGMDLGYRLPLQTTYTEWAQSDFARRASPETCQSCHMPLADPMNGLRAARIPGVPMRTNLRRHDLMGANAWGMDLLREAFPGERDDEFRAARTRIEAYLRTAARVEVTQAPTAGRAGERASITVRVTNLSGHKLPTGYEDARVMWLQVQVGDRVVSGAFTNDELVEDPQARVYRLQLGRMENGRAVPNDFVVRHSVILEDTRIPPLGMRATRETEPVGRDYTGAEGGALRNYDDARFELELPQTNGPVPVTVRLLMRSTTKHYVEAIAGANRSDNRGAELTRLWNASGRAAPVEVASATAMITVSGATITDAGVTDAGVTDAAVSPPAADDGGCSARPRAGGRGLGALGMLALAALAARRRAR